MHYDTTKADNGIMDESLKIMLAFGQRYFDHVLEVVTVIRNLVKPHLVEHASLIPTPLHQLLTIRSKHRTCWLHRSSHVRSPRDPDNVHAKCMLAPSGSSCFVRVFQVVVSKHTGEYVCKKSQPKHNHIAPEGKPCFLSLWRESNTSAHSQ